MRIDAVHAAALELVADTGEVGLALFSRCFSPLPDQAEIERCFVPRHGKVSREQPPAALVHRVHRPRGGNQRAISIPFHEALQLALWDLTAKQVGLPLHQLLGTDAIAWRLMPAVSITT